MSFHGLLLRAFACLLPFPVAVAATTRVIVTIDVESLEGVPLPSQIHTVCDHGRPCGLDGIVETLEAHSLEATFFLNVYEHAAWGEPLLRDIARMLHERGHEVALHTHPQWSYDPSRVLMREYSLEEQMQIVADGVRLLEAWTGAPVVSHRAGAYGVDANTFKALAASGIPLDSSYFAGHANPRLGELGIKSNLPDRALGVVEIPVTIYERAEYPWPIGALLPAHRSIRKIDPDWFLDEKEAVDAVDAAVDADLPFVVVFLHSFSLMASADGQRVAADRHSEAVFAAVLRRVAERGLPVVTMRDLAGEHLAAPPTAADTVPTVSVSTSPLRYAWHSRSYVSAEQIALYGAAALVLCAGVLYGIRAGAARKRAARARERYSDG